MKYSVVIPSYNEGWQLAATVESVLEHSKDRDIEVIVVDDQSDDYSGDDAALRFKDSPVKVMTNNTRSGVSQSKANGAAVATGDTLIFMDAHSRVEDGWLDVLDAAIALCGDETLFGPSLGVLDDEPPGGPLMRGRFYHAADLTFAYHPDRDSDMPYPVMMVHGKCQIINRHYYEAIGGYDVGVTPPWGAEDMELSWRVWMLGGECRVIPGVTVLTLYREAFPYGGVLGSNVLCNLLRVAYIHFGPSRFARCITARREDPDLGRAIALLMESDVAERRAHLAPQFVNDADHIFYRFGVYW